MSWRRRVSSIDVSSVFTSMTSNVRVAVCQADVVDRSPLAEDRKRHLGARLPSELLEPLGDGPDERRVSLVDQAIELACPEPQLDPQLRVEGPGDCAQGSDRDVLDSATLDERDEILTHACFRPDVGLTPSTPMAQHPVSAAESPVVHRAIVDVATHRTVT